MRVIFVGVHNKPGKPPLCSTTKTGKIIDRIIEKIDLECEKTNLYDFEYLPVDAKIKYQEASNWYRRINPQNFDVVVLLGQEVKWNMLRYGAINFIEVNHPSSLYGKEIIDFYVEETARRINAGDGSYDVGEKVWKSLIEANK